jgi:hypothetical protein
MVRRRHGRPIGIADSPAQRGGQEIQRHIMFITKSDPDQGKGLELAKSGNLTPCRGCPFCPAGDTVQSACQLHRGHPRERAGPHVTQRPWDSGAPRSPRWSWTRRTAMDPRPRPPSPASLIRFRRPLLRRHPAGGASAHFQIRVSNRALAPLAPVAFGRSRRGGPADAGQPRPGTLRAGLVEQTPAGPYKAEIYGMAVKGHPGAWAGKASPEPGGLTGPISPGPCGPGSALSAGPHAARTCNFAAGSRARTGVVRPPGGTVRFGDAAAARCGEHCRVTRRRQGRSAVNSGGGRVLKLTQSASGGMLAARLAGRLNGPR